MTEAEPTKEELDASTQRLTEMVATLANALSIQGELQQKTIALSERQTVLDEQAAATAKHVATAEGELNTIRDERVAHQRRRRRNRWIAGVVTTVVVVLGGAGVYQVSQNHGQQQQLADASYQRDMVNYQTCLTRNAQIAAQVKLWKDEQADALRYQLPALATSFSDALAAEPAQVNCRTYKNEADQLHDRGAR